MHRRTRIRRRVVELLRGATVAGQRVWANRFLPLTNRELPAILVYALDESIDPDSRTTAPRELTRRLSLAVDGIVAAGSEGEIDDALDALSLEIETALHRDPFFGTAASAALNPPVDDSVAADSILTDVEIGHETVGDRLVGRVAMTWEVEYQSLAPEPPDDDSLDDFLTMGVTYDLGGTQAPDDEAHDEVVVQEEE